MTHPYTPRLLCLLILTGCPAPDPGPVNEETPSADGCSALPDAWPDTPAQLDTVITEAMVDGRIPGMAACLTSGDQVLWCRAYGWANIEDQTAVTPTTPFLLASISKLFTATAVLQAHELGELDLDANADDIAPFSLGHPDFPQQAMTPRQLLAHAGGVADNDAVMEDFYEFGQDPTIPLDTLMEGYFDPDGQWFDARSNFQDQAPGRVVDYSNMGSALAGYLAQQATGVDLRDLTRERILEPLGMVNSGWRLTDFDLDQVAMPYSWTRGEYSPHGHYTFADYPNGGLRSSAADMGCFMAAMANGGALGGSRVLQEATLEMAMAPAFPNLDDVQGLGWYKEDFGDPQLWIGHNGGESGANTDMFMRQDGSLGLVMLMNSDGGVANPIIEMQDEIILFGEQLLR